MEIYIDQLPPDPGDAIEVFMDLRDLSRVLKDLQAVGRAAVDEKRNWVYMKFTPLDPRGGQDKGIDFVCGTVEQQSGG